MSSTSFKLGNHRIALAGKLCQMMCVYLFFNDVPRDGPDHGSWICQEVSTRKAQINHAVFASGRHE
jgi:hypothetical protein